MLVQALEKKIKQSPKLQKQRQDIENSLSTLAYAESPCLPSASLRESILAAIQPDSRFQGFIDRFSQLFDIDKKVSKQLLAKIDHNHCVGCQVCLQVCSVNAIVKELR